MEEEEKTAVKEREKWGHKIDFILSCLGYAVGLGNIWRFPYLCGRNGGAAFLIPYFLMMIFAGFPVFYLELALGQYTSLTPHLLYRRMSPIFTGVGYTMLTVSAYTVIYYNIIIAWSIYYFCASFQGITGDLPWRFCNNTWNTDECYDDKREKECRGGEYYFKGNCYNETVANTIRAKPEQTIAQFVRNGTWQRETAAQQYNKYYVLNEAAGIEGIGWPKGDLVCALLGAWILVFFCLVKGIKSSGKVVYFTATFPYVLLIILCIRGNLLPGAGDGIEFFIVPNISLLASSQPWIDAAHQIFFSLSMGGGSLTTLASYNIFNNNLMRDTLIVVLGNSVTSILAGFTIFPIIGYIAKAVYPEKSARERVSIFAKSGTTLAFVAYPDALDRLPTPWVWCLLFFFMLILLGIDSQFVVVEVLVTAIVDQFPQLRKFRKKTIVLFSVCLMSFTFGLLLTTPIGTYVLTLVDTYAGGIPLLIACLVEVLMVAYVYGYKRFIGNIKEMMGKPPNRVWKLLGYPVNPFWWICWIAITPALLLATLIMNFVNHSRTTMGSYTFPVWAEIVGWCIMLSCVLWIPGVALYRVCATRNWKKLTKPTDHWGRCSQQQSVDCPIYKADLELNSKEQIDCPYGLLYPALMNDSEEICRDQNSLPYSVPFASSVHVADSDNLHKYR
uniref:Transporter n=1 Tax=Plectus sambesii TaxID=2011161 RepID=A0A914VUB5_9BILA